MQEVWDSLLNNPGNRCFLIKHGRPQADNCSSWVIGSVLKYVKFSSKDSHKNPSPANKAQCHSPRHQELRVPGLRGRWRASLQGGHTGFRMEFAKKKSTFPVGSEKRFPSSFSRLKSSGTRRKASWVSTCWSHNTWGGIWLLLAAR